MTFSKLHVAAASVAVALVTLAAAQAATPSADPVRRGEYLVRYGGCHDCHTPVKFDAELGLPLPDMSRALSGHPEGAPDPASAYQKPDIGVIGPTFTSFALPFGVVYSANITSDPETGIGKWKEGAFVKAMRTGRHAGVGRAILPPMPLASVAALTDEDLRAVYLYLMSTKPIRNAVPRPKVPPETVQAIGAAYDKLAKRPPGAAH